MPMYSSVAAQVKVHVCELGLMPPRLNGGPVCDDSAMKAVCQMWHYM